MIRAVCFGSQLRDCSLTSKRPLLGIASCRVRTVKRNVRASSAGDVLGANGLPSPNEKDAAAKSATRDGSR